MFECCCTDCEVKTRLWYWYLIGGSENVNIKLIMNSIFMIDTNMLCYIRSQKLSIRFSARSDIDKAIRQSVKVFPCEMKQGAIMNTID